MSVFALLLAILFSATASADPVASSDNIDYAIVVSESTLNDVEWKAVAEALVAKHNGRIIRYDAQVESALPALKEQFPRYTCFVAKPGEATADFVRSVHQLTRRLDDDPYTDTLWAILTGHDAKNALEIARHKQPLVIRKVASGTEVALEMCQQGLWYDELIKHKQVKKDVGGKAAQFKGPGDTTKALAETLTDYKADLFVTSGHADERSWMIGFRYRNGKFVSKAGQMFGEDKHGNRFEITSPNPKVYLPIGNCSMGHIDGSDAMALAWMNSCGVRQMIGYIVPTWYGYGGWGCLDYFVEQPGRYTFVEAFHANHHALIHKLLAAKGTRDERGLAHDRDVVALYGDPKWEAHMAAAPRAYEQQLVENDGTYTFTVEPQRSTRSFEPINTNGSQRGWRPIIHFLPWRIKDIKIIAGADLNPIITDSFILVPNPRECDPQRQYKVVFRAETVLGESSR
jgi:zinc protease